MSGQTTNDAPQEAKQAYVKPGFRTISLVAEEVMAVGCKLPSSNGPFGGGGGRCTLPTPCLQFNGVS
jgi:hypothetical protein